MKHTFGTQWILPFFILVVSACAPVAAPSATNPVVGTPTNTVMPTSLPSATPQPEPTKAPHTFTPATYKDETNAFELDYPSGWTLVPNTAVGSRGSTAQLFSPGSTAEKVLDGGTRMSITVYQWDPKNDLAAYADHRKSAFDSDGHTIISSTTGSLVDARKQMSFTVQGPDKLQSFFMLTTLGDNYLEIAGDGNRALIEEIAKTLRPLNYKP